jgi:hypothetical protein
MLELSQRLLNIKDKISGLLSENTEMKSEIIHLREEILKISVPKTEQKTNVNALQEAELLKTQMARKDMFINMLEAEKRDNQIKLSDLDEQIALMNNTIEIQKNTINDLKEQNKLIKLAKEISTDNADNHDLKIKINQLVRDIDRCIDLLNE